MKQYIEFLQGYERNGRPLWVLSLAEMPINYDLDEEESAIAPFEELCREFGYDFAIREMNGNPFAERFFNPRSSRLYLYLQVEYRTGFEPTTF